jgi:hypothetical protein
MGWERVRDIPSVFTQFRTRHVSRYARHGFRPKTKENAANLAGFNGVQNAVQNTPLHNTTPGIILQGRWVILEERPDGCHIVLIEDDVFYLLRVLPYGGRGIAYFHAKAFAEHYGAQCGEWR